MIDQRALNWKSRFRKENIFFCEYGEALQQVAQRSCEYTIRGGVEGQVRWESTQPGLMKVLLPITREQLDDL